MPLYSKSISSILITIILLSIATHSSATELITLSHAWIADAPPNSTMYAGYISIKNNSNNAIELVAVSSPMFKNIEIHKTQITNNIARMIQQDGLTINKKQTMVFAPGGLHLMMIKPKSAIKLGGTVILTLKFKNNVVKSITANVKKRISN